MANDDFVGENFSNASKIIKVETGCLLATYFLDDEAIKYYALILKHIDLYSIQLSIKCLFNANRI